MFPAYLWGIETMIRSKTQQEDSKFPAYLWGIETIHYNNLPWTHNRSQPTYEELKLPVKRVFHRLQYGSQPTYEELKPLYRLLLKLQLLRSQPTYEELKLYRIFCHGIVLSVPSLPMRNWNDPRYADRRDEPKVPSLPMRNWNHLLDIDIWAGEQFPAYLWGIETSVPIGMPINSAEFPAYLWGIETHNNSMRSFGKEMFPAYLWGIETKRNFSEKEGNISSQPTYEELKRLLGKRKQRIDQSSQPTYEELKLWRRYIYHSACSRSQPTYEELKQYLQNRFRESVRLFPAYLWGIETSVRTEGIPGAHVPSLPMRNWNSICRII